MGYFRASIKTNSMKKIAFLLLLFISNFTFSQTPKEIDSVSMELCDYLKTLSNIKNDTLKITTLYQDKLYPYLGTFEESKIDAAGQRVYYRLQRNCVGFRELLDRLEPPKEKIVRITTKPVTKQNKKQLAEFKKRTQFKYKEFDGSDTYVEMKDNKWTDTFTNNTYSKLTYKWLSDDEFQLTFIESNNETRSNFSFEGDKFNYIVLDIKDDHYLVSVNIEGQNIYEEFKLFFE